MKLLLTDDHVQVAWSQSTINISRIFDTNSGTITLQYNTSSAFVEDSTSRQAFHAVVFTSQWEQLGSKKMIRRRTSEFRVLTFTTGLTVTVVKRVYGTDSFESMSVTTSRKIPISINSWSLFRTKVICEIILWIRRIIPARQQRDNLLYRVGV